MYYIVLFAVYFLVLLAFIPALKKPRDIDSEKARRKLAVEMLKRLSKSDRKDRRKRAKVLPRTHRVLYLSWYMTGISIFLIAPMFVSSFRSYIMEALYAPETTFFFVHHDEGSFSQYIFPFAGIALGMVLSMGLSYLTYTKTIERADVVYKLCSFQNCTKRFNIRLAFITIAIMFPIAVMSFNSYRLLTENEIVIKCAYSFSAGVYPYSEIGYVEQIRRGLPRRNYESFTFVFHTKDGKKLPSINIGDGHRVLAVLLEALRENDVDIYESG